MGSPLKGTLWRREMASVARQDGERDTTREVKRSGEGKVLEGLSLARAYYERSGCGWMRAEGIRGGEASNGFGHFSPRFGPR